MTAVADDLPLKLEYYEIRDLLLGRNWKKQDVKRALELASTCRHPVAQWLTKIFAGKDVKTREEARDVFLAQGENDARALCFLALTDHGNGNDVREARLRRSAEMGFAFAQAELVAFLPEDEDEKEECFRFASLAASQGERDGSFWLGHCYQDGVGCEKNLEEAKKNYMLGIKMGCVYSMLWCGNLFDESDPQRWHWWGEAAKRGNYNPFLDGFSTPVNRFKSDPSLTPAVFMIGRYLRGQVDLEKKEIFGKGWNFDAKIGHANRAIDFFVAQCAAARKAVDTWCLIARRVGDGSVINKDIRNIKKDQNKDIDYTQSIITILNVFGVPLLVIAVGLMLAIRRRVTTAAI